MILKTLTAGALGAGLMYFLDPDRGRRRRAIVRDKSVHLARETQRAAGIMARDLKNRTDGMVAEARSALHRDPVPDDTLVARVRTRLGRAASHVRALHVEAKEGNVMISGPVLADEADQVRAAVHAVRGVKGVDDHLEVHPTADIPELQGGDHGNGDASGQSRKNWVPATRLVVGATGGALALYALGRRGIRGAAAGSVGVGAILRAFATPLRLQKQGQAEQSDGQDPDVLPEGDASADRNASVEQNTHAPQADAA